MPLSGPTELAHYSSTALGTTHTTAASTSAQAAGTLIVVSGTLDGWVANSVTDTNGNSYTRSVNFSQGGATTVFIAWAIVAAGKEITTSTTWTVTPSGSAGCNISVQAYGGIDPNPLDQFAAAGVSTGTDLNSGNTASLTGMDDLMIGACALNASTLTVTPEVLSPVWTGVTTNPLTNTTSGIRRLYTFYREQTGGGTPRFDSTTSATITSSAAGIVAFKVLVPVGSPQNRPLLMTLKRFFRPGVPMLGFPQQPIAAAGGITTNQALTADSVLVTASLQKQANKNLAATAVAVSSSLVRQVNKALITTAVAVTSSLQKQASKTLTATTIVITASLVAMKVILKALTATVAVTASLVKQANKSLTAIAVVSATLRKQANKAMTATAVVLSASLAAIKVILRTLTATTVVVSASLVRQINKPLVSTVVLSSSLAKQANKKLTATTVVVTANLAAIRVFLRTLTATSVVVTASLVRQAGKPLSASVVLSATVVKRITKTLTASTAAAGSLIAQFVASLGSLRAGAVSVIDTVLATVGLVDTSSASVSAQDASAASATATDATGASASATDISGPSVKIDDIPG